MKSRCLAVALTAVVVLGLSLPAWCSDPAESSNEKPAASNEEYYELLKVFVDTLDQLERNYVQNLSRRELLEAAIEGMVSKLDEHSNYIAPEDLDRFKSDVESEFGGVGIQVSKPTRRDALTIVSPLVGSPAYRAGLMAGDVITHIEGEPTTELSLSEAVKRMKGPTGTSVEVTVRSPQADASRLVKLTREIVRIETVMGDLRNDDDSWKFMHDPEDKIGYVRVTAFARHTPSDLRKTLRQLKRDGMRGLILDLRHNPGGLLSSAIQISDLFLSEGRIVSTEGRNTELQTWDARRRGTFEGFPMAVLVNGYSASASEIVAACLQDHERAGIIGERTFGKGSVQNIIELENGRSALKLTTAGYKRPSGANIHRFPDTPESDEWGVRPDDGLEVKVSLADRRALVRQRQRRDIAGKGEAPAAATAAEEAEVEVEDAVLEKARAYIKGKLSDELAAQPASESSSRDD